MLRIIDAYHGNQIDDFAAVRASGIVGVIHKASQGAAMQDSTYASRRQAAKKVGLLWGAYHFLVNSPVPMQLANFLDSAEPDHGTLVAVDYEKNASTPTLAQLREFCLGIQQRLDRRIVLYSGDLLKETLKAEKDAQLSQHRLWIAHYGAVYRLMPLRCWNVAWMWQFTEKGEVPGISGHIDVSQYPGTREQLVAEWAA